MAQIGEKTTTEYGDWTELADGIDQNTVEQEGPTYPYIQYVKGNPKEKRVGGVPWHGGWFIQGEQIGEDALAGWEKGDLIHADGSATDGFFSRDITVALIHQRRRWLVGQNGDVTSFPWDQYDEAKETGRPTGQQHVLVLVKGLEERGPFALTLKGSTSASFSGSKRSEGVLGRFNRLVIRAANILNQKRRSTAKWPFRAFWLTLGPERNDKGEPIFTEVGTKPNSSIVTLPMALGLHEKMTPEEIHSLFVGRDLLQELNQWYADTDEWAHRWDESQPVKAAEAVDAKTDEPAAEPEAAEELSF
jgi:hypothetical protein